MYKELTELPVPSAATFVASDVIHITSTFQDHIRNVKRTVNSSVILTTDPATSTPPQDLGDVIAFAVSPSRQRRAILREIKEQDKIKRYVEIWNTDELEVTMDVTDAHGPFYTDEYISSLSFSAPESSILYIAEANSAPSEDPYQKFRFKPQFGEGIAGKKQPTIFMFSWHSTPEQTSTGKLISLSVSAHALFGQAIFGPDENTLYATGYEYTSDHRLLGLKWCHNRPCGIWEINLPSLPSLDNNDKFLKCAARKLTPSNLSCRSPRIFTHNGKHTLLWLSSPTGGAHAATSSLHSLDITSGEVARELVEIVFDPPNGGFPGLYPHYSLSPFPFVCPSGSPTPYIITHTTWHSRTTVVLISTADGLVKDLTPEDGNLYSWNVLNTDGESRVICSRSTPTTPHELILGEFGRSGEVTWRVIRKTTLSSDVEIALSSLRSSLIPIPDRSPTETIVIHRANPKSSNEILPCITMPHGGPHTTATTSFSPATVALALEGYTISSPNYTGSPGFGESAVRALLGNCGTLDVEDCIASTRHLVSLGMAVDGPGKQFIMGGSHGGFISAHLIGQFPEVFTAAILRNPVISVGEMSTTDIPDWYYAEFGLGYPLTSSPSATETGSSGKDGIPPVMSPEAFARLHRASPIAYVNAVRASVLLLVGSADLRVAPTQGIGYYHALKARTRRGSSRLGGFGDVQMLIFEGESHPLEGVEASRVGWEAGRDFFAEARKVKQ